MNRLKAEIEKLTADIRELNIRLAERTEALLAQHAKEKLEWQSRPCMASSGFTHNQKPGNGWEIVKSRGGHVFAWMRGPEVCGMNYLYCIGCGQPYHILFPSK